MKPDPAPVTPPAFGEPLRPALPCLALRRNDAAKALGISTSLLDQWTQAGIVPHYRRASVVLYSVKALEAWLLEVSHRQEGAGT